MAIRSYLYFEYAGKRSVDFNIVNVNVGSGMIEEPFVSSREIREIRVRGRDEPYFQEVIRQPLEFSVSFAFEDTWNYQLMDEVICWLTEYDDYQPLKFVDEESNSNERIYYALVIGDPMLIHNGLRQGYVNLKFRCNSPYAFSPLMVSPEYHMDQGESKISDKKMNQGVIENLIVNEEEHLILDPNKTKWINISPTTTWNDL